MRVFEAHGKMARFITSVLQYINYKNISKIISINKRQQCNIYSKSDNVYIVRSFVMYDFVFRLILYKKINYRIVYAYLVKKLFIDKDIAKKCVIEIETYRRKREKIISCT